MPTPPSARTRYDGDVVLKKDPEFGDILVLGDEEGSLLAGVRPPGRDLDEIALGALAHVARPYTKETIGDRAGRAFATAGLSEEIQKVTDRLNRGGLSDAERLLCSDPDIYGALLLKALQLPQADLDRLLAALKRDGEDGRADDPISELFTEAEQIDPKDTESVVKSIRRNLRAENYLSAFEAYVAETVFRRNDIRVAKTPGRPTPAEMERFGRLLARLRAAGVSLAKGTTERQVLALQQEVASEGSLPSLIDLWAQPSIGSTGTFFSFIMLRPV